MLARFWNWYLTPSRTASEPPTPAPATPSAEAIDTVQQLAARIRELEAQSSQLQLEWADTLDKIGRWASRTAARERRRTQRDLDQLNGDGQETHEDAPGSTIGGGDGLEVGPVDSIAQRATVKAQLRARAAALNLRR